MRFTVDGWDPTYGTSLELEEDLGESTAKVTLDVEYPENRWRPVDVDPKVRRPGATLFVDGVRRVEARVWIDHPTGAGNGTGTGTGTLPGTGTGTGSDNVTATDLVGDDASDGAGERDGGSPPTDASAALCASYAAGVVCCCRAGAHLLTAETRRGLFTIAPHAVDVATSAGSYVASHTAPKSTMPLSVTLSSALQGRLAEMEVTVAVAARGGLGELGDGPGDHATAGGIGDEDLLVVDGPLRGRTHLPRALGFIKSHRTAYLPPPLHAMVGRLTHGQRTPVFLMGTNWDRHAWYLRLPCLPGAPWAGIVRVECSADLPAAEVIELANLSQATLCWYASAEYKDARAPQNLYPIAGLERELRRRLGDPRLLYRALRVAAAT